MKGSKNHIFFFLAKLPLLLLYASFFMVQLFYNFDITSHAYAGVAASTQTKTKQHDKQTSLTKSNIPAGKKACFRLNKRYQPEAAITCDPIVIKPLICAVSSKLHVHYSDGFSPSASPRAHLLRGPPAVV